MLVQIKDANEIHVGDVLRYIGTGFQVNEGDGKGAYTISKNAQYDATVIQITDHLVALSLLVDQGTIRRACCWGPKPYNWSVMRKDIKSGHEKLFKEVYN